MNKKISTSSTFKKGESKSSKTRSGVSHNKMTEALQVEIEELKAKLLEKEQEKLKDKQEMADKNKSVSESLTLAEAKYTTELETKTKEIDAKNKELTEKNKELVIKETDLKKSHERIVEERKLEENAAHCSKSQNTQDRDNKDNEFEIALSTLKNMLDRVLQGNSTIKYNK